MFESLKEYAEKFDVPIIKDEGLEFLISSIRKYNVKSVLEIGTAIGYSALNMALYTDKVTSLERNSEMFEIAKENISIYGASAKINLVFIDALTYETLDKFDLIFIDAAKAQNRKFFERYQNDLNENGIIIVDNLNFHGLVNEEYIESKNLRNLVRKIKEFKEWLKNNTEYETQFTDYGDGMSISTKKK